MFMVLLKVWIISTELSEEPSSEIINSISTPTLLKLSLKAIKVSAIVLSSL